MAIFSGLSFLGIITIRFTIGNYRARPPKQAEKKYKYIISISCVKDPLTDRVVEGGLNWASYPAILGGCVVKFY